MATNEQEVDVDAPIEHSAAGYPLVRYCLDCGEAVDIRWTFGGDPVFWTCDRHGIRDSSEVDDMKPDKFARTNPEDRKGTDRS